jgi:hypothetical protein
MVHELPARRVAAYATSLGRAGPEHCRWDRNHSVPTAHQSDALRIAQPFDFGASPFEPTGHLEKPVAARLLEMIR